jgi:hypothetical protein
MLRLQRTLKRMERAPREEPLSEPMDEAWRLMLSRLDQNAESERRLRQAEAELDRLLR